MNEFQIKSELKNNYEHYYESGDSEWRRLGALGKARNIVSLCNGIPATSVLEIGAGEGSVLQRLSEVDFGKKLFAVEISSSGVATILRKKIKRLVDCQIFDGYSIPYKDNEFDLAILTHVVEHVEHPRHLIYEASRVARNLFIEVPLEDTVRLPVDFISDPVGHINYYSPKTIRRLLQSCDLRILQQVTCNPGKETYSFQKGAKGLFNYYTKELLLRSIPRLATQIFTYHAALVCERRTPHIALSAEV